MNIDHTMVEATARMMRSDNKKINISAMPHRQKVRNSRGLKNFDPLIFSNGRYLQNNVLIVVTQAIKKINRLSNVDRKKSEIWARKVLGSGSQVTSTVMIVKVNPQNSDISPVRPES